MKASNTIKTLTDWLLANIPAGNNLLVPVSGGSDSAFVFWLCNQVLPERTKGIYIGTDLLRKDWFDSIGRVELAEIKTSGDNPEIQRWATFLTKALTDDRILVGSRNLTEDTLGTFSNASRVAQVLPLARLWKHQVMELCDYVGVPKEITESSRQADPECGRPKRMADIPFEIIDKFLQVELGLLPKRELENIVPVQLRYMQKIYKQNSFKSLLPAKGPVAA